MIPKNSEVRFEVVNQCNYNCKICMKDSMTRPKMLMGYTLFKDILSKVLKESDQYKNISFAGIGEPTLNIRLVSMIRYAASKGLKPLIVTNGSTLNIDSFSELQDAGVYSIRISFHGVSPKGYSAMHGIPQELFHIVKKNLDDIFRLKNRKTKVLLTCVLAKGINDEDYQPYLRFLEEYKERFHFLHHCMAILCHTK